MTTMDELERAVERLADVEAVLRLGQGGIARGTGYARRVASDLRALLSERAELLAAVERMRGEMAGMEARLRRWEPRPSTDMSQILTGAAFTTGEGK